MSSGYSTAKQLVSSFRFQPPNANSPSKEQVTAANNIPVAIELIFKQVFYLNFSLFGFWYGFSSDEWISFSFSGAGAYPSCIFIIYNEID